MAAVFMLTSCSTPLPEIHRTQLRSFDHFETFERRQEGDNLVLLSPRLEVAPWNELIVSWNAYCPPGTALKVEAGAFNGTNATHFYEIARWSSEAGPGRTSSRDQSDAQAAVETDTVVYKQLQTGAQVRLTLSGQKDALPQLKLITFSFLNNSVPLSPRQPNRKAWGTTWDVPQRSQLGWSNARGWCSPTSISMILAWWAQQRQRPELDLPVPDVARNVYDEAYGGTGNWIFNTAFAGSFEGLRAYVTRVDDLRQVEDCVASGVPVALSVSFDLLNGKEADMNNGHLIVVVGFTESGDVVVNDPWPNPKRENSVRKVFPREQVIRAWQRSRQTIYLVVPNDVSLPREI